MIHHITSYVNLKAALIKFGRNATCSSAFETMDCLDQPALAQKLPKLARGVLFPLALWTTFASWAFADPPASPDSGIGEGSRLTDAGDRVAIQRPYQDLRQQAILPGLRSFFLAPWRAYLDTWPAKQYLDCLGINFNVDAEDAEATAKVLAEGGFRSARVEFGWANLEYDNPNKISNADKYAKIFTALRRARIRPLIVLNANAGSPVPFKTLRVNLARTAPRGAREIFLDRVSDVRSGYTGLMSVVANKMAFPLITSVDSVTGRCDLSAPLPHELAAGPLILADLKYHPFSRPVFEDGKPNRLSEETTHGWRTYVASVCALMKEYLGTEGEEDAGFDLEVWNELTFGSDFLSEDNYYQPKRAFKGNIVYQNHGLIAQGVGSILPMTVDYVNDPTSRLPGVHVISGLSNQRPWESGYDLWPGQAGFSRHFYTALDPDRAFNGVCGFLSPATIDRPGEGPLNALGLFDGKKDRKDWQTVVPGSFFAPTLQISMPELWHYGYKIEYVARDVQPFPGPWSRHFRFSNPGNGDPAEVWMTETNTDRSGWLNQLRKEQGLAADDARLIRLSHHVGAKALLRTFVFQSHKGVHTIEAFAAREKDLQLAIIPEAFFAALQQENHRLTDHVRSMAGEQLAVLARVNRLLGQSEPISVPRTLDISEIVEHEQRLVFKGDGTPAHPDRFNRDDFACLPFQLTANRYAIPYYVVTQNMVHDWRPELDPLDPSRYDMPEQTFDVTLNDLNGTGAKVSVWDPFSDQEIPATILSATSTSLAVRLPTVDYPRFLIVQEVEPGPLILNPNLQRLPSGAVKVSFQTNLPVEAKLSWGPWPQRNAEGNVDLPAGMAFGYIIPELTEHEGVKIKVTHAGLTSCWPHWDYDVAGVRWPETFDHPALPDPVHPPLARLPGLPPSRLPDAYDSKLPPGLEWRGEPDERTVSLDSDQSVTRVSLKLIGSDPSSSSKLLPDLCVMDHCAITLERVGETLGWRAEIKLDPSTHPWDPGNCKVIYIFPTSKGWLKLQWEGDEVGLAVNRDTLHKILTGLSFRFGGG